MIFIGRNKRAQAKKLQASSLRPQVKKLQVTGHRQKKATGYKPQAKK
jgi:hypothetical protein